MKNNVVSKIITLCLVMVLAVSSLSDSASAKSAGYQFKYKGVTISMHSAAKNFIKKAGKPVKTTVKKSCAYKGKDRTYKYKDFILYTYSKSNNGPEYVNGITFLTKKVATKEGIKIGSTEKSMKKKYGKAKAKFLVYTYKKGSCKLQIEAVNGKVKNIRYVAVK